MNKINVGIIGCGGFIRNMHIPNLLKNSKFNIYATMDINEKTAKETKEDTNANYYTTDINRILNDKNIHAVFIGTRHDTHASLSIKAAKAKKHVFCEKPMGLSEKECEDIVIAVKENNVKYTVGYNRGMAPMILKAKDLLKVLENKKMVYHRIQAPFPEEHWAHDVKVGGGRFVGEGCHIFDLICEVIGSEPISIFASGGTFLDPTKVHIPDSAIITITFEDGSVGTTLIASAGCADFEKEVTEIYCDNKAIYINNFQKMEYYGFDNHKKIVVDYDSVDKGQMIEIDQFADAIINNTKSPNGLLKARRAAIISYKVLESLKEKKPISITKEEYYD